MTDWELIVIDDGSTDNTKETIREYKTHPKIRIIEQENKGLNVTNNIALRLSNGKYIIRLDADDYFDENILTVLSSVLDTKSEVSLVYPDYYHVNVDDEVIEVVRKKKIGEEVDLLDLHAHGACTMIRKECLLEIGGYEEDFSCQDSYDIWLKFINIYKPYNVNIPLFYYRQHPKSLTKKQEKILDTRRRIKEKFVKKYKNGEKLKVLGIVPVVGTSIYPYGDPFIEINSKPLIWYTLNEVKNSKKLDRIVVSSYDDKVLEYSDQFPGIQSLKRPKELAKAHSSMQEVAVHVINHLRDSSDYYPDAVCILSITAPLRKYKHIDKAIDTLIIFDVDSVISIQEELSYCYFHRRNGLTPVSNSKRHLRIERNAIYKENGAVYLSRTNILEGGELLGNRISHIAMLPEESIKINNNFDIWLAEKIIAEWQK
tara:strand:- start:1854 stop:3137 length:1284 start_codon:yes stop_codon:yes gene_type:complete